MILANFDPKAVRQGRSALIAIAVVAALAAVAMTVFSGGATVAPVVKLVATAVGLIGATAIVGYCFTVLAHLKPHEPAVWIDGRLLLTRSPHLTRLTLDRSVTVQTVPRRSLYGPFDELIVTNGQGEKLSIYGFYTDRAVSDLAAQILLAAA